MNFLLRLAQSFSHFMYGRYGNDSLNQFLALLWIAVAAVNLFFHSLVLYVLAMLLGIVVFYRMLSRNYIRRQRENAAWYRFRENQKKGFRHLSVRFRDRKIAHFFKCPKCKAPIRMPRKIGTFDIRCSNCGHTFQKKFKK